MPWTQVETTKTPYPTGERVEIRVPKEFAADFLTKDFSETLNERSIYALDLGGANLGKWQVVAVRTERVEAGYEVAYATLREVWL